MSASDLPEVARLGMPVTDVDGWTFELESARQTLLDQLHGSRASMASASSGGRRRWRPPAPSSATCATRRRPTWRTSRTVRLKRADTLLIDPTTLKHLEVVESMDGGRVGSLLHEIDRTVTPMGGAVCCAPGCCGR
jgi:DNA mismatch repair protein MutS